MDSYTEIQKEKIEASWTYYEENNIGKFNTHRTMKEN